MMNNEMESNEPLQTPGATLRAAREQMGVSQQLVAKTLLIKIERIQALEEDCCERFCDDVYIRGYLRSYAKYLKLDGEDLVCLFNESCAGNKHGLIENQDEVTDIQKPIWVYILALMILVAFVYLVSLGYKWMTTESVNEVKKQSTLVSIREDFSSEKRVGDTSDVLAQDSTPKQAKISEKIESVAQPEVEVVAQTREVTALPVNSIAETETTSESVASDALDPLVAIPAASLQADVEQEAALSTKAKLLYLSFSKECWLEVRDVNGDVLTTDLQLAGSDITLTGEPPFKIKLGHAEGVSIKLNDDIIPLPNVKEGKIVNLSVGQKS